VVVLLHLTLINCNVLPCCSLPPMLTAAPHRILMCELPLHTTLTHLLTSVARLVCMSRMKPNSSYHNALDKSCCFHFRHTSQQIIRFDHRPLGLGVQRRTRIHTRYAKIRGSIPRVGTSSSFLLLSMELGTVAVVCGELIINVYDGAK
jgi:hypothetical protein